MLQWSVQPLQRWGTIFVLKMNLNLKWQKKKEGKIDEETYEAGYKIAIELMKEFREQKNDIVNRCQFDLCRIKTLLGL